MEQNQVVTILESLANGIDPTTGAACHDAFATPDVIRALFIAAGQLKGEPAITPPRKSPPAAAGARWTDEEDLVLCEEFDHGIALSEIATRHGRTKGAITSRLVKLGRIDPAMVKVRDRGGAM